MSEYVRTPASSAELEGVSRQFEHVEFSTLIVSSYSVSMSTLRFSNAGEIDGKHVVVQAPKNTDSTYFNYKALTPLCCWLFVMHTTGNQCNDFDCALLQLFFPLVDVGEVGRHSDGGVLSNSSFGQALETGALSIPDPSPLPGITTTEICTFYTDIIIYLPYRYYTTTFSLRYRW